MLLPFDRYLSFPAQYEKNRAMTLKRLSFLAKKMLLLSIVAEDCVRAMKCDPQLSDNVLCQNSDTPF